jgi:hypothetical protein
MASPLWQTPAGNLGTFHTDTQISIQLTATPVLPSSQVFYQILSGSLPLGTKENPLLLDTITGIIYGTPHNIIDETSYLFTVRASDEYSNIRDRTFSITLIGSNRPYFVPPAGELFHTVDSVYIDYQLEYVNNISDNVVDITLISGYLPPGLQLLPNGLIRGYPIQPLTLTNSYTTITYTFTVLLNSSLGSDTNTYSITISNQSLTNLPKTRLPVILNSKPLKFPIPLNDLYYDYYLIEGKQLPDINSGDVFLYKIIGYDFDNVQLVYNYANLPKGLKGDPITGWITGTPTLTTMGKMHYEFYVTVNKSTNTSLASDVHTFSLTVVSNLSPNIKWITDSNLGSINNTSISELMIQAESSEVLQYQLADGVLPPNLTLLSTGEIIGRVSQQPTYELLNAGDSTTYVFSIVAYSQVHQLVKDTKEFTLTVTQEYQYPLEDIYLKANPDLNGRKILYSLLNDDTLLPTSLLYRPTDPYYGKAKDIVCPHVYGVPVANIEDYLYILQQNHYYRKLLLGDLKVAVARDDNFNIIYEVVYSEIIDSLSIDRDVTLPQTITWPRNINLRNNSDVINNSLISISNQNTTVNSNPGYVRNLYPSSLINMSNEVISTLGQNTDHKLLPKWMTSQQLDGQTIGFIQAWVLCYATPGNGNTIVDNIKNNWPHKLNEIDFTIDRYFIDKSYSYNFNTNFVFPFWSNLPSATPAPIPKESNDITVLFPRKTILPTDNQN